MKATLLTLTGLIAFSSSTLQAQELDISITNLTQGIYFTPLLVTAHASENNLFMTGQAASAELQAMAEGGDISGLVTIVDSISANTVANPAEGLLAPAQSTMTMLSTTENNTRLSITGMILPSNDGFVGLNSWAIPSEAGTYTIYLNAYDAGTEANNELIVAGSGAPGTLGIPAAPGMGAGTMGSGLATEEVNPVVHIHPGNIGDDMSDAGKSDLSNTVHRWLNPVAKVTVTVK